MNYEKKYKEALERAMKLVIDGYLDTITVDSIFSELKESEDEKIRKEIVNFITSSNKYGTNERCEAWLNWLEKQGEKKTLNADEVIDWIDSTICNAYNYDGDEISTKLKSKFKKDFGLC